MQRGATSAILGTQVLTYEKPVLQRFGSSVLRLVPSSQGGPTDEQGRQVILDAHKSTLGRMRVEYLRNRLTARDESAEGTRDELIARLMELEGPEIAPPPGHSVLSLHSRRSHAATQRAKDHHREQFQAEQERSDAIRDSMEPSAEGYQASRLRIRQREEREEASAAPASQRQRRGGVSHQCTPDCLCDIPVAGEPCQCCECRRKVRDPEIGRAHV